MVKHCSVLIVGAGIAGCAAARTLVNKGINDIKIFEATDRIGGRVKTAEGPHGVLEYGAQWLHGEICNPLFKQLNKANLIEHNGEYLTWDGYTAGNKHCYQLDGSRLYEPIFFKCLHISEEVQRRVARSTYRHLDIERVKQDMLRDICHRHSLSASEYNVCWKVMRWKEAVERHIEGGDASDVTDSPCAFDDCGGKNFAFPQGTMSLFEQLLLPTIRDKVELCQEVEKIRWDASKNTSVSVYTTNGGHVTADHVLVTCSVGYLQRNHERIFNPGLPPNKVKALERLRMGLVEKLLLHFDRPFWPNGRGPSHHAGLGLLIDRRDEKAISRYIESIIGREASWWKELVNLDTVSNNPNVLLTWLSGHLAHEAYSYSDEEITQVTLTLIQLFTGIRPAGATKLFRTYWGRDEHFLGSYSIPSKAEDSEAMLKPLGIQDHPVLLFAGEAYHPKWMSTMHGAFDTGRTQANHIARHYKPAGGV